MKVDQGAEMVYTNTSAVAEIFDSKIVRLATGEALVFCPTALLDVEVLVYTIFPSSRSPGYRR
jgi:hypothetical protein